ncbi:ABC transporter ATP-binding protein [Chloroflexota bacterium]
MVEKLLSVEDLKTYFLTRRGVAKAVDGVSLCLGEGESLGLVGESGCGKSVTCLSILRLVPQPAGRIVGGRILLEGEDLLQKSEREMRKVRGRKVAMIPQDAMTSLDPVFSIGSQLSDPIKIHQKLRGRELWNKAIELLRLVRIPSPEERLRNFPHQLSGGMRQRTAGAIALSCQPRLLIADESTTSLDVTIQAQFLDMLRNVQQQFKVGLIFVTHDFGIVESMCDRVAVMYAGKVVEEATVRGLFDTPLHPYTAALMRSVPKVDEKVERLAGIGGQPPPLYDLPPGCSFLPRCPTGNTECQSSPPRVMVGDEHWVSCWRYA